MLREVSWFEVKGELVCSPRPGAYTVSWRARLENFADGWDGDPVEFTFSKKSERKGTEAITRCRCYLMRPCRYKEGAEPEPQVIFPLENVWMEFDVGKFDVEEGEGDITLSSIMIQTNSSLKKGLTLGGLVIRPIKGYDFDGHPRTGHRFRSEKSRSPVQDEKSRTPLQDEKSMFSVQYWTWVDFLKFHYVLTMLAIFVFIVTPDQCIWN